MRLAGDDAVDYARKHDLLLCKFTDPTEEHRDDVTPDEAEDIMREDPALIYLDVPAHEMMHKPDSLVEALEASMTVQAAFEGARGDAAEWKQWETGLYEKAHTLAVPADDWEKFLALCDILCERDEFCDGREDTTVLAIEDGYAVWSTVDTSRVHIFAGAAVDIALHEAPEYGYNPPENGFAYDGFLMTDAMVQEDEDEEEDE